MQEQLQSIKNLTQFVAEKVVLVGNDVKDIKGFCEVLANREQEARSQKLERQDMPSKPAIFFGRGELVERTSKLLSLSETAIHKCLLGPGGMGKTSLALAIIESPLVQAKFREGHRVWIPCVEAISATLFLQVLYTSLRVKRQTDNIMSDILDELNSSKEPYLLLLDNFETAWNTTGADGQKRVEDALRKLNKLNHVSILITMRGSHSPTVDVEWHSEIVPGMDKGASLRICQRFNPHWKMDPDLDSLLDAVGCMPFAVTLVATRGRESGSSPKQLLDEWTHLGTDMWSPDGALESGMNKSISLSVDSTFVKSNSEAIKLLATLSLLPAGTTRERLKYWAPNLKSISGAITTLSRAALLQTATEDDDHTSQTLFVLPVIQSFMLRRKRIPKYIQQAVRSAFCKYILDHACRYRDPFFKANSEALAREDVNIQSILVGATNHTGFDDELVRALLAFSWYRRDTKPLIAVAEHTLNVAKANGNKRYIAEALLCLGSSYSAVSNYVEAKGVLEESSQLLAADDSRRSQQLDFECALARISVFLYLKDHWEERKAMVDDLLSRTRDVDMYWCARALEALGWLYWQSSSFEQALEAFVEAANIMKGFECTRDRASALYGKVCSLDRLYISDQVVHEALQEVWEIARDLEPSSVHGNILLLLGEVYVRMGYLVDAMKAFEKCLSAYQYVSAGLGVAQALDRIGFVYLHIGAYSDAYLAFGTAAEAYTGLGENSSNGKESEAECRENMMRIKLKQENPNQRIGFYRPRSTREQVLFYPTVHSHP